MLNIYKVVLSAVMVGYLIQADAVALSREEIRVQNKEYLQKMGINLLDGEVKIVKAKTLMMESKDNYYLDKVRSYLVMHKQQEKNGFVKSPEPRAKELLDFIHAAKYQYRKYSGEFSPSSTHLRHNITDLKMAYTFVGVPESAIDKSIGVAPYGAYKESKYGDDGNGWDGAVQFFEKNGVGICEFKEHNIKLAHGGVELIQELVSEEIFGKPTVILTTGNKETGFLYQISWYDNTFSRELACAAPNFSRSIQNNVIDLAKLIEKAQ